jgi:hypothetical protein
MLAACLGGNWEDGTLFSLHETGSRGLSTGRTWACSQILISLGRLSDGLWGGWTEFVAFAPWCNFRLWLGLFLFFALSGVLVSHTLSLPLSVHYAGALNSKLAHHQNRLQKIDSRRSARSGGGGNCIEALRVATRWIAPRRGLAGSGGGGGRSPGRGRTL